MEILSILFMVIFVAIPVLVVVVATLQGFKRNILQAVARLVMTLLAIVVSMLVTKFALPAAAGSLLTMGQDFLGFGLGLSLEELKGLPDILGLLSTLLMPAVFFVVFAIISFIFSLLYLIPKKLLSKFTFDKNEAKQVETVNSLLSEDNCEMADDENNSGICADADKNETITKEENEVKEDAKQGSRVFWKHFALRSGAVLCSVLSALLILAFLALPLNYYPNLALSVMPNDSSDEGLLLVKSICNDIDNHPVNACYQFANGPIVKYLDNYRAANGASASAAETVSTVVSLVTLGDMSDNDGADLLYTIATGLEGNAVLDSILTDTIHEAIKAWRQGEDYLGMPAVDLGNAVLTNKIYDIFLNCDSIAPALRIAGDVMSLQKVMESGEVLSGGDRAGFLRKIFDRITSDSASFLTEMVSGDILVDIVGVSPDEAQPYSELVESVLGGVVDIKEDPNMSDVDKEVLLDKEANALTLFLEIIQKPEELTTDKLIESVVDSQILSNTVCEVTDNGTTKDPYNLGEDLNPEFADDVKSTLKDNGVSEDSELYNSVIALIGGK